MSDPAEAEKNDAKFEKGTDKDISGGPLKKGRWCTDIICCPLFIAHIVLFWIVTFSGFETGKINKLYLPRDYAGQYCGLTGDDQWESSMDLENYEKKMWSMNVTEVFDPVAKALACSSTGYSVIVDNLVREPAMTQEVYETYCGTGHDASLVDNLEDLASSMTSYVTDTVLKYTDPANAADLFTGGGATDIFTSVLKTFNQICAESCGLSQSSAANARSWTYEPDADIYWGTDTTAKASVIWLAFRTQITTATATGTSVDTLKAQLEQFNFDVWPTSACPYEERLCVPMPGTVFEELSDWNNCLPKVDSSAASSLATATVDSLNEVAELDVTEDLSGTVGTAFGDVMKTWDVLLIVCVISFVIGFIWLVLLRFILGPLVWTSMFLVFALLALGGVFCIARANQCADQGLFEAAETQAAAAQDQADAGNNPFERECPGGYAVQGSELRTLLQYCGYILFGTAGVYVLAVICLCCRIRLAIALCKVALQFMYHNPTCIFVPIVQAIVGLAWVCVWAVCAAYLLSSVPDGFTSTDSFTTYDAAKDECENEWPAGWAWKDSNSTACTADEACWKCTPPRFIMDYRFAYSFFSLLWHNCFLDALGQIVLAAAVGIWFFTPREEKGKGNVICPSLRVCLFYHTGTIAFGSLILAIVKFIKWYLRWLAKQAKAQHNKVMEIVFKCLAYAVWCFERCIKFLNKNAYIQTALMGTNFCKSAWNAFCLILRNALRFLVLTGLSYIIATMSKVFIIVGTGAAGYLILWAMYPDVDAILPTMIYVVIGWMVAQLFMNVKEMAVDTTLQCFIATEEMGGDDGFVPEGLKSFVDEQEEKGQKDSACCGCWGCACCC